jgi:glycosyltransferase involved in cell wall biosynthesis
MLRTGDAPTAGKADVGSADDPAGSVAMSSVVAEAAKAPFILYVSTIERRKNHETLYKAWVRLIETGYDVPNLLCVGMRGWGVSDLMADLACDPRIKGRIRVLHDLSDPELAHLYAACEFTVYPSLYEGWGLPVVESFAFGKFCLCSNTGSLVEAGGSFAEYLDPWDVQAWADRVRYLSGHPEELEKRNRQIEMSFKPYLWCDTMQSILGKVSAITGVDFTTNADTNAGQMQ